MKACPCGSGLKYDQCCKPYISGVQKAPTAEALMRSRYTAYANHAIDYIVQTCVQDGSSNIDVDQTKAWSEKSEWLGLRIISVSKGGPGDTEGTVEFEASYSMNGLKDLHHEVAAFKKNDGQWLYESGKIIPTTVTRTSPKVGRNDSCPCGSGKKYKHCCGKAI